MGINRYKDETIEVPLSKLPNDMQTKIVKICKIVREAIDDKLDEEPHYDDLKDSNWAMSCLDDFKVIPSNKSEIGTLTIVKNGRQYRGTIQVTGHFKNHQYGWIEELLHELLKDVHQETKPIIRRRFDVALIDEGDQGNPLEGWSVLLNNKTSKSLFEKYKEEKKELKESVSENLLDEEIYTEDFMSSMKNIAFKVSSFAKRSISSIRKFRVKSPGDLCKNDRLITQMTKHKGWQLTTLTGIPIKLDINRPNTESVLFESSISKDELQKIVEKFGKDNHVKIRVANESDGEIYMVACARGIHYNPQTNEIIVSYEQFESLEISNVDAIYQMIGHEFGHYKTWSSLTKEDIVKYQIQVALITSIGNLGSAIAFGNSLGDSFENDWNTTINYYYHTCLKPEVLADKYAKVDPAKLTSFLFSGKVNTKLVGKYFNIPGILSEKYDPKIVKLYEKAVNNPAAIDLSKLFTPDELRFDVSYTFLLLKKYAVNKSIRAMLEQAEKINLHQLSLMNESYSFVFLPNILYEKYKMFDNTNDFMFETFINLDDKSYTIIRELSESEDAKEVEDTVNEELKDDSTKEAHVVTEEEDQKRYLMIEYTNDYAKYLNDYFNEASSKNNTSKKTYEERITDLEPSEVKRTLGTLASSIISNNGKVTQYTANTISNLITKNLLPVWKSSYKKLTITVDPKMKEGILEFKTPSLSQDFISRYIHGREPLNAFLHRIPEIKIKMDPSIFKTLKDRNDLLNFFKAAVNYYDNKITSYSDKLTREMMRMNPALKELVSTTNMSGLVVYPMKLLFVFDKVDMSNYKDTFKLTSEEIKAINQFVRNIYTRYSAPEKEKKKIVDDIKELIGELKENCDYSDDIKSLLHFDEAVHDYLFGKYDSNMELTRSRFYNEQVDIEGTKESGDANTKYIREKFGVKKLKKIPRDLIPYITIEAESIKDANDKYMIASYCTSKIEIVEWYIELLDTNNPKYIVPHPRPYLVNMRTQLLACYKKIMDTKIPSNDRPIISVDYPDNYKG